MSTHDPQDGLTDGARELLDSYSTCVPKVLTDWIRALARENAALKAERDQLNITCDRLCDALNEAS